MSSDVRFRLNQDWPTADLEHVGKCPLCDSTDRILAFDGVQDWSFNTAPGKWAYWDCLGCKSLYLDPRPSEESIGRAYHAYYTHAGENTSYLARFKVRLRHEYFSFLTGKSIAPRLNIPRPLSPIISLLRDMVLVPFGLRELAEMPGGRYVDVGCGQGSSVKLAAQMGWRATGIEIDPAAASVARASNLDVRLGTYELLTGFKGQVDYMQCSHVVEHVHNPRHLLSLLKAAIRPGGLIAISCPNSRSPVRAAFGKHWRGIEAPRHLAIPSRQILRDLLAGEGFQLSEALPEPKMTTEAESFRIRRGGLDLSRSDVRAGVRLHSTLRDAEPDFIRMICRRSQDNN